MDIHKGDRERVTCVSDNTVKYIGRPCFDVSNMYSSSLNLNVWKLYNFLQLFWFETNHLIMQTLNLYVKMT